MSSDSSDIEKLKHVFQEILVKFGSIENILEGFGLSDLPTAQRYGILFGFIVFSLTISSVMALLIFGGTFKRIVAESKTGKSSVESDHRLRLERPLLLERLLSAQERMQKLNYPSYPERKDCTTNLTKMLSNVAPPKENSTEINENFDFSQRNAESMVGYKQNFFIAYRKCQDKPGGATLVGRPEARYEAYARAYAGCGDATSLSYRRSYSRLYESVCCESLSSDDKFSDIYKNRPQDVIGKFIRLEPLDLDRHLNAVFDVTNGDPVFLKKAFDPQELWGFKVEGPFSNPFELSKSFVFKRRDNEAAFAILQNLSDRLLGTIILSKDDPMNLSIQLDQPLIGPSSNGTKEQMETCFLLMDRLFAHGYRRIQISIDSKDNHGAKLSTLLGFTYEGCLLKEQIIKECSRDSNIYGMLNSDWNKGARNVLYKKLYGATMLKADLAYNLQEEELDHQQRILARESEKISY